MADLSKIFIRTNVDGHWGSFSLQELCDKGEGGKVYEWALSRLGSLEVANVSPKSISLLVDAMEEVGVGIAKLK